MNIITYPERNTWADLLKRPTLQTESLRETVLEILNRIKFEGDKAVLEYEEKFDKVQLNSLLVSEEEIAEAEKKVSIELKAAITLAYNNIRTFHAAQVFQGKKITTLPGVTCWQKAVAIEKVGLYIPGGTAPLFSTVLMLATPAQIAGCKEIILCTPPNKEGKIHPGHSLRSQTGWHQPRLQSRRGTSYRSHGLWHGKHSQSIQDIRSGQPVCHCRQTAGFLT